MQRIIRDTAVARAIKVLYDYQCQICGTRLETSEGPYAEAAHIRPLGSPHDGPDSASNLLCLCPNHHVLFDHGGLAVQDNFDLIGYPGRLQIHGRHQIDLACVQYHRERYSPLIRGEGSITPPRLQKGNKCRHELSSVRCNAWGARHRYSVTPHDC
ncbi:HNH endonuclease [Deinococcus malanensis]|uniref:HNH endonuclease n=1 Tax=Deinococcus malanensis TaxID=1706855 RepID=UPI0036319BC0